MQQQSVTALLLRQRPLKESDLLLDCFSLEQGRIITLARGGKRSKKRFFGLLITGHLLEAELSRNDDHDLWQINGARLLEPNLGLRANYMRWLSAAPILEVLLKVTALQDPSPEAFTLSLSALQRLTSLKDSGQMAGVVICYLVRLASCLGFELSLDACLHCGKPMGQAPRHAISLEGGLTCCAQHQGRSMPVSAGVLRTLCAAQSLPLDAAMRLKAPPRLAAEAFRFLGAFYSELSGRDLPALQIASRQLQNGR